MSSNKIKNNLLSLKKSSLFIMCLSTCLLLNADPCLSMIRAHDNDNLSSRPTKKQRLISHSEEISSDEDSPGASSESNSEGDSGEESDSNGEEEVKELYKLAKANIEEEDMDTAMENLEAVILMGDQTNYFGKAHYQLGMLLMATDKTLETAHHLRTAAEAGYGPACARWGFYTLRLTEMNPKRKTMRVNALRFLDAAKEDPKGAYNLGVMYKNEKATRELEYCKNNLKILTSYKKKMKSANEKGKGILMNEIDKKKEKLKIEYRTKESTKQNKADIQEAESLLKFAEQNLTNEEKRATAAFHVADIILDKIKQHPSSTVEDAKFNTYLQKAESAEELVEQVETLESAFKKIQNKRLNFKKVQKTRQNKGR